ILDMAWEDAACRPDEPVADGRRGDCIATISRTPDGRAVVWQPADYDLTSLVTSVVRQAQIDRWAQRLARTMVTYEQELHAVTGEHASFYLVGHSLGGQVVVRALRAILEDPWLRQWFADGRRGMLQAVVSIDGALNWAGAVGSLSDGPRCGLPVHTLPDESLEADNVRAVEAAYDAFGTLTVAMTSATDPIVGPDVALLRRPPPSAGYVEVIAHEDATGVDECSHSALLWPEPTGFPLNAVLIEHVGRAAGE
ncbi:MAG TPA: hypothetical protein VNW68_02885, partial [Candidatus Limnocylindria bacterium]|nr:hypothetical protein [Candidatus Limnocylindria bacterium]